MYVYDEVWLDMYGQCSLDVPVNDEQELERANLYPHLDAVTVERTAQLRALLEAEGYGFYEHRMPYTGTHREEPA